MQQVQTKLIFFNLQLVIVLEIHSLVLEVITRLVLELEVVVVKEEEKLI